MDTVFSVSANAPAARRLHRLGFSVMELVVLIAMIGVLSTIALSMMGKQPMAVRNAKLESDVATLNQMVAVYEADGGDIKGLTSAQDVLNKLKRSRPQADWVTHTGPASGRLVDIRLKARITSAPQTPDLSRAKWNTQTRRFEMTTGGGSAVSEFYLDNSSAGDVPAADATRAKPAVKYNEGDSGKKNRGWVWGNSVAGKSGYLKPGDMGGNGVSKPFDPSAPAPVPPDPGGGDGGGGNGGEGGGNGGSGGDGGGSGDPKATQLPRPSINPPGGSFAYGAFPNGVTLAPNGAPSDGSRLEYRVNNGAWTPYNGSPISVGSADKLQARNFATDTTLFITSLLANANYYRLVTGFSGNGTATWGNATGGPNLVTSVQNGDESSTIKHGNTKREMGNGQQVDTGVENVLTFTPKGFDAAAPNTYFDLGQLLMLNGETFYNSEADGVTLSLNLNLTDPAKSAVIHINLGLVSTENGEDRLASADIVELRNPTTDFTITVDGVEYALELSWATLDPGAGVAKGNQFLVFEGATAQAALRGRFVSKP